MDVSGHVFRGFLPIFLNQTSGYPCILSGKPETFSEFVEMLENDSIPLDALKESGL
jgi:hypothetical protein